MMHNSLSSTCELRNNIKKHEIWIIYFHNINAKLKIANFIDSKY